jgi:transposase
VTIRPRHWPRAVGHATGRAAGTRGAQPARIAKLVGIAPLNDDSGKRSGARHIHGERAEVRVVLYMATLTATRVNPVIKAFYQQLRARGKAQKVALTAAMRKLLIILNAMVKTQTLWNGNLKTCA